MEKFSNFEIIALISTILLTIVWLFFNYFKRWYTLLRSDVKCDLGIFPFGSHWREIFRIESWCSTLTHLYYKYPNDRFVVLQGVGGQPEYLIRDPELVKQITIRDFSSFVNPIIDYHVSTDPVPHYQLGIMKNDDWRRMRAVISSLMTGQKLKQVVIPSLDECKRDLVQFLNEEMEKSGENELVVDMMDLSLRSCTDAFCLAALGLKTDSLHVDGNNYGFLECTQSYVNHSFTLSRATFWAIIKFPRLMKFLFGKTIMPTKDQAFFTKSCMDIADKRNEDKVNRPDYLQLLQAVRDKTADNKEKNYTDIEIVGQCFEFYRSVVTENTIIISYLTRQLADNPDIQERLREEMIEINSRIGDGCVTYELVNDMKYADAVISEGFRICPIATELKRRATEPYVFENSNGEKITVLPGEAVWIPGFILQNDEQFYPNPSVFDPNRFSDENKKAHVSGTNLPFGIGPRDCIGCLQPMIEVKLTFYYLLLNFTIEKSAANSNSITLRKRKSHSNEL